jgi:hypothetical protein
MALYTAFRDYDHKEKIARGVSFTIDVNGHWYCHDPKMGEGPILREKIAGLFAGAGQGFMHGKGLRKKAKGGYELFAPPHDLYGVEVEDVPFIITQCVIKGEYIDMTTQFGEMVRIMRDDLFYKPDGSFPNVPYVMVRDGLEARVNRNVYYELIERGVITA